MRQALVRLAFLLHVLAQLAIANRHDKRKLQVVRVTHGGGTRVVFGFWSPWRSVPVAYFPVRWVPTDNWGTVAA